MAEDDDWQPFDGEPTRPDDPDPFRPVETGPHDVRQLAGYDIGKAEGKAEGIEQGREEVFAAIRLAKIEAGSDPGIAYVMVERFRRWMELPETKEKLRVDPPPA